MLRHAIIGKAVDLVSGPGGLASFLRTRQLGARLAGPSLPLDVGLDRHPQPRRHHHRPQPPTAPRSSTATGPTPRPPGAG